MEVSGKNNLTFAGSVSLSAAKGKAGTLLLDPDDLYIVSVDPNPGITSTEDAGPNTFNQANQNTGDDFYVLATNINNTTGSVVLQAGHDIIFHDTGLNLQDSVTDLSGTAGNAITMNGFGITTAAATPVTLNSGAGGITNMGSIDLTSATLTLNSSGAITQQIDSSLSNLSVVKQGAGTLTLSQATYGGVTTVEAGTVRVTNATGLGSVDGGTTVNGGATVDIDNVTSAENVTLNTNGTLRGTGNAQLTGALTLAGTVHTIMAPLLADRLALAGQVTGANGFNKTGAGTVVLSNNTNNYTGLTQVQEGTLSVTAASGLGALGAGNETTVTASVLSIDNTTSAETVTLDTNGTLRGTGTASLTGVLTLAGVDHTITAPVGADTLTLSGQVTGAGGFSQTCAGTVVLANNTNDYTGVTAVQAGTLVGDGGERPGCHRCRQRDHRVDGDAEPRWCDQR